MADMFEEARHVIEDDIRAGRYAATYTNPPHTKNSLTTFLILSFWDTKGCPSLLLP